MVSSLDMPLGARRLVRRYYLYAGLYTLAASIIWGINTLFLLDAGLSVAEVFVANSAFSVGTVLFEIPTGVVADTLGRRSSFLLSLVVLGATTLLYVGLAQLGAGLLAFSAVSVLMGLGFTFYSGATEAWLVDGLSHHGYDGGLDRVFSRGQIVSGAAMLVGTVAGGVLGQADLAFPFVVRAALLLLLFVLAFSGMHDLGFEPTRVSARRLPAEAMALGRAGIRFGWKERSLRLLMLGGAIQTGFFMWAWYAWQPYFQELLDDDAVWVAGVVAALLALSMMVGNGLVEFFTRFCGRRTTLMLWAGAALTLTSAGIGFTGAFPVAVGLLMVAGVGMGMQAPVRQAFFHNVVPSEQRATVLSFDSMVGGVGGVGGQSALGGLAQAQGFSTAYVAGGAAVALAVPVVWLARRIESPADFFVGTRAGSQDGCIPHGLPTIAHVDASSAAG